MSNRPQADRTNGKNNNGLMVQEIPNHRRQSRDGTAPFRKIR